MFLSSGYFKGLNCPYYASGLCERSYCHFRHVKSDSQPKPKQNTVVNINKGEISNIESEVIFACIDKQI